MSKFNVHWDLRRLTQKAINFKRIYQNFKNRYLYKLKRNKITMMWPSQNFLLHNGTIIQKIQKQKLVFQYPSQMR